MKLVFFLVQTLLFAEKQNQFELTRDKRRIYYANTVTSHETQGQQHTEMISINTQKIIHHPGFLYSSLSGFLTTTSH